MPTTWDPWPGKINAILLSVIGKNSYEIEHWMRPAAIIKRAGFEEARVLGTPIEPSFALKWRAFRACRAVPQKRPD